MRLPPSKRVASSLCTNMRIFQKKKCRTRSIAPVFSSENFPPVTTAILLYGVVVAEVYDTDDIATLPMLPAPHRVGASLPAAAASASRTIARKILYFHSGEKATTKQPAPATRVLIGYEILDAQHGLLPFVIPAAQVRRTLRIRPRVRAFLRRASRYWSLVRQYGWILRRYMLKRFVMQNYYHASRDQDLSRWQLIDALNSFGTAPNL
ncbi:unnamed protein product [Amoebophrya sp. A120]|nr:unnamed protein product [Amoebophrya sp. A120]|eukprot:GSA120T00022775001.1